MKKQWKRRIAISLAAILAVIVVGCAVYLGDYYHGDMTAIEVFISENAVERQICDNGDIVFEPDEAVAGFIFYPGGKVEHTAYIPLMNELASRGILCVLVEMPFRLAVFDVNAADGIIEQYPQIGSWYIGGHSLGGSMACSYLEENAEVFDGLVLLGSYSTADLSGKELEVLSIFGSEDMVLNYENYAANKENLPNDYVELEIEGGCHAYFGMYGAQEGDGTPAITNEEQIVQTSDAIINMINQ